MLELSQRSNSMGMLQHRNLVSSICICTFVGLLAETNQPHCLHHPITLPANMTGSWPAPGTIVPARFRGRSFFNMTLQPTFPSRTSKPPSNGATYG